MRKSYIGAKIIQAIPAEAPLNHEREGEMGYRVFYPDGHVSWSPKDTFENAYREVTAGEAELIIETPPGPLQPLKPVA